MTLVKKEIVYKTVDDVALRMFLFETEPRAADAARPAIVFFFGGGWARGTPEQFFPHCGYFASRGMLAVSAEYRVRERHGTTPVECVEDGKSAVRWLRVHAGELCIDAGRIAAGGGSSGGHVALCTALIDGLDDANEDPTVSSKPDALVLFNPAVDLSLHPEHLAACPERIHEISPAAHVRAGIPPTIIFHGTDDAVVPLSCVERFVDDMTQAGNLCTLIPYDGQPHAFFNYRDGTNPYYAATVRETDRFLAALGWLTGEPTVEGPS